MSEIATDLQALLLPAEWRRCAEQMPEELGRRGYEVSGIWAQEVDLTCEPDNMLATQYAQVEGHPPIAEVLHHIVINGSSELDLRQATAAVVACLPEGAYWYGTSVAGHLNPGGVAACAWQHPREPQRRS
ncbi:MULTISPECIES: hypothetical protein [unclassified Corynebacterium]|uniref:hypothetical protein n=1 Tax=unclassified Corynebacterium TaxID=2624378 RepID=UPI0029C9B945|nr:MULTISPECIES: hypothetical protein [unclassified Corynebacterium]WPF65346.1 hypothetical protein OLX12_07090 [Corynebacterium sp. 22KM0430]WPF67841.1 hypothetical protein OLW90_07080 [Corynebacterium sp. 21KM1197]